MNLRRGFAVAIAFALVVCFYSLPSQADPGALKWKYPSSRGYSGIVKADSKGNRIFVASSDLFGSGWLVVSLDKDRKVNWQASSQGVAKDVAIDSKDNIIVVGYKNNGLNIDWKIVSYSPSGEVNWERSYDSESGPEGHDAATAVAVDSNDNVIVVGYENNGSDKDWKVIFYSSSGEPRGGDSYYNTRGDDEALAVAVDSNDNAIVVGYQKNDDKDWKVVSYSPLATKNWERSYNSGSGSDVAIDSKNNAIVVGYEFRDTVNWKIISYSPSGNVNWEQSYDSGGYDGALAVAIDSKDNVIAGGFVDNGDYDWNVVSYSSAGVLRWEDQYDSGHGMDGAYAVAVDSQDNAIVVGYQSNESDRDWRIVSYSPSGSIGWRASYDSQSGSYQVSSFKGDKSGRIAEDGPRAYDDRARSVAIDETSGDILIAGTALGIHNSLLIDCEGYPPSPVGHVLVSGEVRTIEPAAESPDANSTNGTYLGFGDAVADGPKFKVEAAFPRYLKEADNTTLAVKIFIAAQLPDDYSRLAFFDSSNNLKFQPPDTLSSWKSSVSGEVAKTSIFPETAVGTDSSIVPSGTHYWYTLVVPDTVPDDFSGVDWSTTPWEITVNVFEVK